MWNIFFKTRINNPTVNIHMDPLSLFLEISTSKSFRSWLVWKMLCGCTWFHECCWYSKMFVESGWIMTLRNYSGWYEYRLGCLRGKQEHLTQLWLCERSFIFAAKERSEFFSWPFSGEYFLLIHLRIWGSAKWIIAFATFFFSIHSGNGMTKNTPKLIPGSWGYFCPFSYFLTPLIGINSLDVVWWW